MINILELVPVILILSVLGVVVLKGVPTLKTNTLTEKKLKELLEQEKEIVRTVCHNSLQEPMYGEKLQDTVIFHLRLYTNSILREMEKD